jgi:hypothetical protein
MNLESLVYQHKVVLPASTPLDNSWEKANNSIKVLNGIKYEVIAKKEKFFSLNSKERIFGIVIGVALSLVSCGLLPVFSKSVRELFTGRQVLYIAKNNSSTSNVQLNNTVKAIDNLVSPLGGTTVLKTNSTDKTESPPNPILPSNQRLSSNVSDNSILNSPKIDDKNPIVMNPVAAIQISDKLKASHIFLSSGPFEGLHTGDTDYAEKIVGILKNEKIQASYITGSTTNSTGQSLYDPKSIEYQHIKADHKLIIDNDNRKQAVANVINYMLSFDGPKIFHLQLRTPETGCMFLPEDLKKMRDQGIQVVVTCHEWQLNNHRPWYQDQALKYFQQVDKVIFLNPDDAAHAVNYATVNTPGKKFPSKYGVSAVPVTVNIENPPTVDEVVRRDKNIITFGLIRPNKGFEQSVALAREIKTSGLEGCKVLIAGKPVSFEYFIKLATDVLALKQDDKLKLKEAWDKDPVKLLEFKKTVSNLQKENRPDALPAEFHIDLSEQELNTLISKSKYAYKPDNKGFANNASAIINLLANGCVTFAKWGSLTDKKFLRGGAHENAIILTKEQTKLN